ncbi:hypothetical protein ACFU7T_28490 [Streptomyces sp. NPDC057555]|uniref:hypothetical protein n=1 Tax=Streptomyces sp. NPDC057555 TaxID=3346166 RepID=UPI00369B01A9
MAQEMAVQLRAAEQTGAPVLLDAYPPHWQDLTLAATTHPAHWADGDEGAAQIRPGILRQTWDAVSEWLSH